MAKGSPSSVGYRPSAPDKELRALGFPTAMPKGIGAPGTKPPMKVSAGTVPSSGQTARPGKQSGNAGNDAKS